MHRKERKKEFSQAKLPMLEMVAHLTPPLKKKSFMRKMYLVKAFEKTQNNPLTYKPICTVHAHRGSVTHRTLRDESSLREPEKPTVSYQSTDKM